MSHGRVPTIVRAIALAGMITWSATPARAQAINQASAGAGSAIAGATTQIVTDAVVASAMGPLYAMLQIVEVFDEITRKTLGLSLAQIDQINNIRVDVAARVDALKTLPPKERREKLLAMLPEIEADYVARIDKVLEPEQRTLFRQLVLQLHGTTALVDPVVAQSLQLTDEQRKTLATKLADYNQRIKDSLADSEDPGPLKVAGLMRLRKQRNTALLAVLTPEQQAEWVKLNGAQRIDVDAVLGKLAKAHLANMLTKPRTDGTAPQAPPPAAPPAPKR